MEQPLRCNNQIGGYCRAALTDEAIVTTCSHIFCENCAKKTGFTTVVLQRRACPVCSTPLPNNDDVVQTRLSPSEDYKTSVLSGLDPTTIMECASRAIAFWTYQTTQEVFYQEHLCKNLTDKYSHLSTAMDKIINEANSEIGNLQNRISNLSVDQNALQRQYDELATAYREKSHKHKQALQLYEALKKKYLVRDAQTAASANVNHTLQSIGTNPRPSTYQEQPALDPLQVYNEGIKLHKARSDHNQVGRGDAMTRFDRPLSEISDPHGVSNGMPPPARPGLSYNIPHVGGSNTPAHRTAFPAATRTAANRSHIPLSTSRQEYRSPHPRQQAAQSPSIGHKITGSDSVNRHNESTARAYGGITNGMKIGRAGTAGQTGGDHGAGQYPGNGSYMQRTGPIHRHTASLDAVGRYV